MIKIFTIIVLIFFACQAQDTLTPQKFRIATNPESPPFEFLENAQPTGLDIDLLGAVARAGNFQYELIQASWADLFDQVKNNQVDFAFSGITINDERKQTYDFSVPYFISTLKILTKETAGITSAQDLVNKIVAVRTGTTGAAAIEKLLGADNPNILRFTDQYQASLALDSDQAGAYVDDGALLEYWANSNPGFVVVEDSDVFARELFGLMFPKGSSLRDSINQAITTVLGNGEYADIYSVWLGSTPDVALLLEAGEYENPYDVFDDVNGEEWNNEGEVETGLNWDDDLDQ